MLCVTTAQDFHAKFHAAIISVSIFLATSHAHVKINRPQTMKRTREFSEREIVSLTYRPYSVHAFV